MGKNGYLEKQRVIRQGFLDAGEQNQVDGLVRRKRKMKPNKLGEGVLFQRIRRITGYLTGDMRTWNDAKKAEEKDRVKHGIGGKKDG